MYAGVGKHVHRPLRLAKAKLEGLNPKSSRQKRLSETVPLRDNRKRARNSKTCIHESGAMFPTIKELEAGLTPKSYREKGKAKQYL